LPNFGVLVKSSSEHPRREMKYKKSTSVALALALASTFFAGPANAAGFSAQLDKAFAFKPAGDVVTVTLDGLPTDQGVYVRLCALPADQTQRPTQCDGQGKWVSSSGASRLMGAGNAAEAVKLDVKALFGSGDAQVNCEVVSCAIHTRRDHFGGAGDFALDRYYPISFKTPKVTVTVKSGKATFAVKNAKGASIKFSVGSRSFGRKITSDSQLITVSLNKGQSVNLKASLASSVLLQKKVKG
jgi:hypothetical protein